MAAERIVSVWHDKTSDPKPMWVVDTDSPEGGESTTIKTFKDRSEAVTFGREYAKQHLMGCYVRD